MSVNQILESQRDAQNLFKGTSDNVVNYSEPRSKWVTEDAITADLIKVGPRETPRWGGRLTFEVNQADSLKTLWLRYDLPTQTGASNVLPAFPGLNAIASYRIMWGNNEIYSVTNYQACMQALLSVQPDGVRRLVMNATQGNGGSGVLADVATSVISPIPFIFDPLVARSKAEAADMRNVAGRLRCEIVFRSITDFYGATAAITTNAAFQDINMYYTAQVFSQNRATDSVVPTSSLREKMIFKSVDIQTTPYAEAPASNAAATLDLTAFVGPARAIGIYMLKDTLADVDNGDAEFQRTIYPRSCRLLVAGREFYRMDTDVATSLAGPLMEYASFAEGNQKSDNDFALTAPVTMSSSVFWLPIGVDQETIRSFAGALDITKLNSVQLEVTSGEIGAARAFSAVILTDANFEIMDRGMEKVK